ncbi:hypothetical protein D0Z03_000435 [Geotrichum reessii]|nr:hypothetical protein D0Z03_000435 [Galactomyces reessii]
MSVPIKQYGVTPPISTTGPTPTENILNDKLIEELKKQGSFESEEATRKRVKILDTIQRLTLEFVRTVSLQKNMSEGMAKDAGGKIFTFGSYRLGVYGPGSDIDTLVVVPKHVTRDHFFDIFEKLLRKLPDLDEIATHRMPVITPAYPSMCATHNITASTQKIIINELVRGGAILDDIIIGTKQWSDFFVKHTFFNDYKYYLSVIAATKGTTESHLKWSGLVESKLRLLVQKLELVEQIQISHPFVKTFDKYYRCTEEEALQIADGNAIGIESTEFKDDDPEENDDGKVYVHTTTMYIGLEIQIERECD